MRIPILYFVWCIDGLFILQVNWCRLSNCLWPTPRFWPFWPSLLNATTSSRGHWEPATLAPACGRFSSSWPSGFLDAWPQGKQPKIDVFVQTVEMSVINSDCWLQTILPSLLDLQLKALFNQRMGKKRGVIPIKIPILLANHLNKEPNRKVISH